MLSSFDPVLPMMTPMFRNIALTTSNTMNAITKITINLQSMNIARNAGPWWILTSQTVAKFNFWGNLAYHKISPNFNFSIKFSNFHVHGSDLDAVQSFQQKFFRSWYLHHLKLQYEISDWTKGKRKRLTHVRAKTQNVKKPPQKIGPRFDKFGPDHHRKNIALQAWFFKNRLYKPMFWEADTCTIWNYNMKCQTAQKEKAVYHKISSNSKFCIIFFEFSCPWATPRSSSNFLPEIFQKLILHHLKLQYEISDWTKGKCKRLTDFQAHTKNEKLSNEKNRPKIQPI